MEKQKESALGILVRKAFHGFVAVFVFGVVAIAGAIFYYSQDLPDHRRLEEYYPETTTRLYAGDGRLLTEYAREKRIFVPIDAMPKVVADAFIAAEDRSFYQHAGIDIFSIIRASFQNAENALMNKSSGLVGASTITQQVAKNILLSNERTVARKIKEAILAFRMSISFSKDRILELYLNEIYLGASSYGVASAAMNYFNKSVDELNVEEAALLAAMPKAPSVYDPRKNYGRALERRNWVLQGMLEENFISLSEARRAMSEPIKLNNSSDPNSIDGRFFSEEVRRWLEKEYGDNVLYEGGLVVRTTLDPVLQKYAEDSLDKGIIEFDRRKGFHGKIAKISLDNWVENLKAVNVPISLKNWRLAVVLHAGGEQLQIGFSDGAMGNIGINALKWAQKSDDGFWTTKTKILDEGDVVAVEKLPEGKNEYGLRQIPKVNGAIVVMDPHTGKVLAMSGGNSFESTQFNRATQAMRQPGSAFKPFVYMTAMENGFTPAMLILDEPIEFDSGAKKSKTKDQTDMESVQDIEDGKFDDENFERSILEAILEKNINNQEQEEDSGVWAPKNYSGDFYGPTTLRIGLENSRNVMTVRLGLALGMDKVIETGQRFGIYENPEKNMSTVLGASETTLMKLVNAYSILVNGGKKITPSLVERIQDRKGKTIFRRDTRECIGCRADDGNEANVSLTPPAIADNREEVTDKYTAYQMVSMMEGVVKRGTAVRAKEVGKPLAGKTGTTNNAMDGWFIGFSPDLVVGVFMGYDQPRSLGERETGSSVALPIFIDFMKNALKDKPSTPFRIPPGIELVKIDRKTGFLPNADTPSGDVIFEAFKPGTAPTISLGRSDNLPVIESLKSIKESPDWYTDPKLQDKPVTRGTGGIY